MQCEKIRQKMAAALRYQDDSIYIVVMPLPMCRHSLRLCKTEKSGNREWGVVPRITSSTTGTSYMLYVQQRVL